MVIYMFRLYIVFILLFLINSCASNVKTVSKNDTNYNDLWIKKVSGKKVVAPNGYLYTFDEKGNVEYKISGIVRGKGVFVYAESETNAYYYEKIPLDYVANDIRGLSEISKSNVNMFVGFVISNDKIKMTSGYTKEYNDRLADWKKNNLTIYSTLREGKDMSEYPIPNIEEVNLYNTIEFGALR